MSLYKRLWNTYIDYYSADEIFGVFAEPEDDVGARTLLHGIDLRTTAEAIEEFKKHTISPLQLALKTFTAPCHKYFLDMGDDFDLEKVLNEEAGIYAKEDVHFLQAFDIEGKRRYHATDVLEIHEIMKRLNILTSMQVGIRMKVDFETYVPTDTGVSLKEVADELGVSVERVQSFGLCQDFGFLQHFGLQSGLGYEAANDFYEKYFKPNGILTEGQVRNWRITRKSLELFKDDLNEAPYVPSEAEQELKRQYKIDEVEGEYLPELPAPIIHKEKPKYTDAEIVVLNEALNKNQQLKKRILWGKRLSEFYNNPKEHGYVVVDDLNINLKLPTERWERAKAHINTCNPELQKLESEQTKKKNGFLTPSEFDQNYFEDQPKDYVTIVYANTFEERFVSAQDAARSVIDYKPTARQTKAATSIDAILEEAGKLEIDTKPFTPYRLDTETNKGEFYFGPEIAAWKQGLGTVKLNQLHLAIGIREFYQDAKAAAKKKLYPTLNEAARTLGITLNDLEKLTGKYLTTIDMGIVPHLTDIINNSLQVKIVSSPEVRRFCKTDDKYSAPLEEGVTNLDEFIRQTSTLDEAQKEIVGEGKLAEAVFEHCLNEVEPIYLRIAKKEADINKDEIEKRIHSSDVTAAKDHLEKHMSLDILRKEAGHELTGSYQILPRRYGLTVSTRDKAGIASLTDSVAQFRKRCYGRQQIQENTGLIFKDDHSLTRLMEKTAPGNIVFLGNVYHDADVSRLTNSLQSASTRMQIDSQRVVKFQEEGYLNLCERGVPEEDFRRLVRDSHSEHHLGEISRTLRQNRDIDGYSYSNRGTILFPGEAVAQYVMGHHVSDITEKGMVLLAKKRKGWTEYMAEEVTGNGNVAAERERAQERLVKYMMDDLNITTENNPGYSYIDTDLETLNTFQQLLMKNSIHNIKKFRKTTSREGETVDPENSYYTRKETGTILGRKGRDLDETAGQLRIIPIGHDSPSGDIRYNKAELYKLTDVARMARKVGDDQVRRLEDPMETIIVHKLKLNNNQAFNGLQLQLDSDGSIYRCNERMMRAFGDFFKIGGPYRNIEDSMLYQKIDQAYRRLAA